MVRHIPEQSYLASPPGAGAQGGAPGLLAGCGKLVMTNARREESTLEVTVLGRNPSVLLLTRPGTVSVMDSRDNSRIQMDVYLRRYIQSLLFFLSSISSLSIKLVSIFLFPSPSAVNTYDDI